MDMEIIQAVADKTAARVDEVVQERLESFRQMWRDDLANLRDELTAKGLLVELKSLPPPAPAAETAETEPSGSPRLGVGGMVAVLIVEDQPDVRRALKGVFERHQMLVHAVADGKAAVTLLQENDTIDVVVADVAMPKNGYNLLEYIRSQFPTIEVVMTSGYVDPETVGKARTLGAFGFLAKPFITDQALLYVEKAAEMRRLKWG